MPMAVAASSTTIRLNSRGKTGGSYNPNEADARIRTADPFITSEVLYQLSYVGAPSL